MFSDANFLKAAEQNFVLVSLDFPRGETAKAKVPNPKRNEELAEKYKVQGFPTVLLMTPEGDVFGQTGYQPGGPEPYIKSLDELRTRGKKSLDEIKAIVAQYEAGPPESKSKAIDKAIEQMLALPADSLYFVKLVPLARDGFKSDPDNQAGRRLRATKALLAAGELDLDIEKAVRSLDPKNENGVYERLLFAKCTRAGDESEAKDLVKEVETLDGLGIRDKETRMYLYAFLTYMHNQAESEKDAAKKWANKLKEVAGDDQRYQGLIEQVLNG